MKPNTQQSTVGLNHTEQFSCIGVCGDTNRTAMFPIKPFQNGEIWVRKVSVPE